MTRTDALSSNPDFMKLWTAQTVSAFGARITREGLPMAAVLVLGASPGQIGVMAALSRGPALIVGLTAGGFVDRSRRRGVLVAMDLLRAAALAALPVAAWLHWLSMTQLYATAAIVGAASVLFEIADHAYLPTLVARDEITRANARLGATDSLAEVAGPAMAGALFQWLGGPYAIALNAVTYLASAGFLGMIGKREDRPGKGEPTHLVRDVVDGVRAALSEPLVAPLLLREGATALFSAFFSATYLIFALKIVGLSTSLLGLTIAFGGVGALGGALLAPRLARWIGVGPAMVATAAGTIVSLLMVPLAPASPGLGMAFLCVAQVFGDGLWVICDVLAASLRQTLLPQGTLGRVAATFQIVSGALGVTGALIGGALGTTMGPRATLYLAVGGMMLGPLALALSPLPRYRGASTDAG